MRSRIVILIFGCFVFLSASMSLIEIPFVVPKSWPEPVYNFKENALTTEKIELGRALFYDPVLSRNNTISCASCHSQYTAFAHVDHDLSHGIDDKIGFRNAPALMNLAWSKHFMWDGAVHYLDQQALAPISNPVEMDENITHVVEKLRKSANYPELYTKAFGDKQITGERTLKAIAQFILTLVSANSKYDKVMRQEDSFTDQERNGYLVFKQNCAKCHCEPLFTTGEFANNGIGPDTTLNDRGRIKITGNSLDSMCFKIPTLRNIEFSYPYMHDGRFKNLNEVINHYSGGVKQSKTLSKELQKQISLSSKEKVDLIAFLLTLTDKEFLFNQKFSYPRDLLEMK